MHIGVIGFGVRYEANIKKVVGFKTARKKINMDFFFIIIVIFLKKVLH